MYETAYEITKFQIPWDIILMSIAALIAVFITWDGIDDFRSHNRGTGTIIKIVLGIIATIVFGYFAITAFSYGGNEKKEYAKLYYSEQYEVTEGKVYDLDNDSPGQRYKVDGVEFDISRADETVDFIEHNGVNVRICYVYDKDLDENIILKLEIEEGYQWMY